MVDFRITWTLEGVQLGMQITFGRVRRKTASTRGHLHI
jgi:hypothetical protein